jgi:hypothetical protein
VVGSATETGRWHPVAAPAGPILQRIVVRFGPPVPKRACWRPVLVLVADPMAPVRQPDGRAVERHPAAALLAVALPAVALPARWLEARSALAALVLPRGALRAHPGWRQPEARPIPAASCSAGHQGSASPAVPAAAGVPPAPLAAVACAAGLQGSGRSRTSCVFHLAAVAVAVAEPHHSRGNARRPGCSCDRRGRWPSGLLAPIISGTYEDSRDLVPAASTEPSYLCAIAV